MSNPGLQHSPTTSGTGLLTAPALELARALASFGIRQLSTFGRHPASGRGDRLGLKVLSCFPIGHLSFSWMILSRSVKEAYDLQRALVFCFIGSYELYRMLGFIVAYLYTHVTQFDQIHSPFPPLDSRSPSSTLIVPFYIHDVLHFFSFL